MSKTNGNSIEKNIDAAQNELLYAAGRLGQAQARAGSNELVHYYQKFIGEDVFWGGHRFHFVGTLVGVEFTPLGEAVAVLGNVWQIGYDENQEIQEAFEWGEDCHFPESAMGLGLQPVSGRPKKWQKSWDKIKNKK